MKNVFKMIAIAMMMAAVFSCEKTETPEKVETEKNTTMTFTADFLATKTSFYEGKLTWEAGDQIAVCDGANVEVVTLTADDIEWEGATAEIKTTTLATDAPQYYAVFPAALAYTEVDNSIDNTFIKDGCIQISSGTINISKSQTFKSYAVASEAGGHFQFKNVGAIVYFKTERTDIASVEFESNVSGDVRGNVLFNPTTGVITNSDYFELSEYSIRADIIRYNLREGDKEAYIPVSAGVTLVGGYTLTAYDPDNNVLGTISTSSDLTFENGKYYTIKDFDSRLQEPLPDEPEEDVPEGALPGKFSVVSSGKQVYFSQGNLYWDGNGSYEFETNQYDFQSSWNEEHVSHFYWSQEMDCSRKPTYDPYSVSSSDVFFTNATAETANPDFTVSGVTGKYRVLSKNEWESLFKNPERMVYGKPCWSAIDGVSIEGTTYNGFFIYPDNYNGDTVSSSMTWEQINAAGIIFLPYAGMRDFIYIEEVWYGYYWTSTPYEDNEAFCVKFTSSSCEPSNRGIRCRGCSVRLVIDIVEK